MRLKCRTGVIMPVYNMAPFIRDAVLSILNQTYTDFELLIVDDASTDNTREIIQSFNDNRITLIRNESNKGLVYGLNFGLDYFDCEYVFRMDGDDISLPTRFEKQVRFMDENPDVVLCGTQAFWEEMDADCGIGKTHNWVYYLNDQDLRVSLIWGASFIHPSVVLRNSVLKSNKLYYDNTYTIACEDWQMWVKLSNFGKIANLNERLIRYRIRKGSLHRSNADLAIQLNHKVRSFYLRALGIEASVIKTVLSNVVVQYDDFDILLKDYKKLLNNVRGHLNIKSLKREIGNRLVDTVRNNHLNFMLFLRIYLVGFRPDFTYCKKALKYIIYK